MAAVRSFIDAPRIVPHEYRAWTRARDERWDIVQLAMSYPPRSVVSKALEEQAEAMREEVDRLERHARQAWRRANQARRAVG